MTTPPRPLAAPAALTAHVDCSWTRTAPPPISNLVVPTTAGSLVLLTRHNKYLVLLLMLLLPDTCIPVSIRTSLPPVNNCYPQTASVWLLADTLPLNTSNLL
jgi:hypothetical protein